MNLTLNDGIYLTTAILAIVALIYRPLKHYRKTIEIRVITFLFINLLVTATASLTRDIIISFNIPDLVSLISNEASSTIYFIMHNLLAPTFALYIMYIHGYAKNKKPSFMYLFWAPIFVSEIFIFLNPLHHLIFKYEMVDGVYKYVRQGGVIALYIIAAAYVVVMLYMIFKSWKLLNIEHMNGFRIFVFIIVLGVIIQAIFPSLQIESLFEVIGLYGIMMMVDCNDGLINNDTKLPNQVAFKVNAKLYVSYKLKYSLVNIKLLNLAYYQNLMPESSWIKMINHIVDLIEKSAPKYELYRYNGETFSMILNSMVDTNEVEKNLVESLTKTIKVDGFAIDPHVVISIAKVPEDIQDAESHSRLAEYIPPSNGRSLVVLKNEDLDFMRRSREVRNAVHRAIKNRNFEVYYQPIWSVDKKKIVCCEALCRLKDSELGFVPPSEFIPIAEEDGIIVQIGDIVFEKVCQDIWSYGFNGLGIKYVEVNLSLYQLLANNLIDRYLDFLKHYNVPTSMINLEITETSSITEVVNFTKLIKELTDLGFTFSLDDYGTAYSNITNAMATEYLNIKMDSSILWQSDKDEAAKNLLQSTIKTFRNLGSNIVQEGVETKEQLDFVINAGANYIQGYYISKPLPRDEFIEFIRKFNGIGWFEEEKQLW